MQGHVAILKLYKGNYIMSNFFNLRGLLALPLIFFVSFSNAEDVTSGTLAGTVVDQSGNAVAGATLAITSSATGVSRSSTSNSLGKVRIPLLAIGSYDATVSAIGFTSIADSVKVSLGASSTYTFTLSSSSSMEEVVVMGSASKSADFTSTTTGLSIDVDELLSRTPVARDLTSLIKLAPGVAAGDSAFGNLASINGSSVAENVYLVNGLNITNFRNFTGSSSVPFEFYDQVEVKTGGYQAEFGKAIGGVVNAVTKSGSNDFAMGVNVYYYPDSLYSDKPNTYAADNARDERNLMETNVYFSGAVIQDKLFYYLIANPEDNEYVDHGLISERQSTLKRKDDFLGAKIDYYLNDRTHIEYTYFSDETTETEDQSGYNTTTGAVGDYIGRSFYNVGGENEIFKITSVLTDNLTISVMQGTNEYNRTNSGSGDSFPAIYDATSGSFVNIGQNSNFSIDVGDDSREMFRFDLDYYIGNHHFRMGIEEEELTAYNATINSGGVYYAYFAGDTTSGYDGEVIRVRNYESGGNFLTKQKAFYIQDSWDVTDKLNLNIGLRTSTFDNKNATGETFVKTEDQDALRLGATYDIDGDGSRKLFASWGEYYLPIAANTNIRMAGGETYIHTYYQSQGRNSDNTPVGFGPTPDLNSPYFLRQVVYGTGEVPDTRSTTDTSLEPMYGEEMIIGYTEQLSEGMLAGWDLSATYVTRELASTIEDVAIDAAVLAYCAANGITVTNTGNSCEDEWTGFHQYVLTNPGTDMNVYLPELDMQVMLSAADLNYPKPTREYTAFVLNLTRAFDDDWSASFSYTNSETEGNYEGTVKSDNGQDDAGITQDFDQPGLVDGSMGLLPNHREHSFKGNFTKVLSANVLMGLNMTLESPRYFGCIGNHPTDVFAAAYGASSWYCGGELTPRGSVTQSNWVPNIDALLSWNVPVANGSLNLRADIFNVMDFDSVIDIREFGELDSGAADPNYLKPVNYQTGRRVRLAASWRF